MPVSQTSVIDVPIFNLEKVHESKLDLPAYRMLKRVIDLTFGGVLAILVLPVTLIVFSIIIKLESKGPVFFIQKRTGKNRKTFYCYKFRTMVVNKDAHRKGVTKNDPRITRSGKLMRKYFIDEVPQLINVLAGNMSLVGPRPHMLRHNIEFARLINNYHDRHKVKPGLTGQAQMNGYHGMIDSDEDLLNRVKCDMNYIRNWTPITDFKMFFKTLKHIIRTIAGRE